MNITDERELRKSFDAFIQLARTVMPEQDKYVSWSEKGRELKNAAAALTLHIDAIAGMWDNTKQEEQS